MLTAIVDRPYGYGRIVRTTGKDHRASSKSATPRRRSGRSGKSTRGIYVFDSGRCSTRSAGIASENAQGEYYLTDLVSIYRRRRLGVETCTSTIPTRFAASTAARNWQKSSES